MTPTLFVASHAAGLRYALLVCCLLGSLSPHKALAQDRLQALYKPQSIQKHAIASITVELYAIAAGFDSTKLATLDPDYRERLTFDVQGRPTHYEATDISIRNHGTAGPHIWSHYEYSDSNGSSHRHDSTVFGRSSEWHFQSNAAGKPTLDQMLLPDQEAVSIQREYLYDLKGRLHKLKTNRNRAAEGLSDDCNWIFYVHDNQSFNATSLSPQDMARCTCSLEYLDDQGRPVRKAIYDATGAIAQTILLTYDRTDKPIRLESCDGTGKMLQAWVDVVYGRNGLVTLAVNGIPGSDLGTLHRLGISGQSFVMDHWADWRLLREIRIKLAGNETARYVFSYAQAK
jgi:hypothetical protein